MPMPRTIEDYAELREVFAQAEVECGTAGLFVRPSQHDEPGAIYAALHEYRWHLPQSVVNEVLAEGKPSALAAKIDADPQ